MAIRPMGAVKCWQIWISVSRHGAVGSSGASVGERQVSTRDYARFVSISAPTVSTHGGPSLEPQEPANSWHSCKDTTMRIAPSRSRLRVPFLPMLVLTLTLTLTLAAAVAARADEVSFLGQAMPPGQSLALWYRRPAGAWLEALPLGN